MKIKYHQLKQGAWIILLLLSMALMGDDLELIATFEGNPNCDSTYFGTYCLFLGDINADGFGDMAIVSKAGEDTIACPYTMKFFWGGPDFDTIPDMILTRDSALFYFGTSYGTNGDINGDGVADLVVGTHLGFYILFGKPDITPEFDLFVPETSHVQYALDNHPTQIIINGDFNGDGYDDIVSTNWYHSVVDSGPSWTWDGITRVYYGGDSLDPVSDWEFVPSEINRNGHSTTIAYWNYDGDDYDDLVIGGLNPYTTRVFSGGPFPDNKPEYLWHDLGYAIATGDINNDGFEDLLIKRLFTIDSINIVYGGDTLQSFQSFISYGNIPYLYDINRDGFADIILSNHVFFNGWGRVDILLGSPHIDSKVDLSLYGHNAAYFGVSTVGVGDIDADGRPDLLVGEPKYPVGSDDFGRAYLFAGDTTITVGITTGEPRLPQTIAVSPAYPNPFNDRTHVRLSVSLPLEVNINLYDVTGKQVKQVVNKRLEPGNHVVPFLMKTAVEKSLPSGIYFLTVTTPSNVFTQKLIYLK